MALRPCSKPAATAPAPAALCTPSSSHPPMNTAMIPANRDDTLPLPRSAYNQIPMMARATSVPAAAPPVETAAAPPVAPADLAAARILVT